MCFLLQKCENEPTNKRATKWRKKRIKDSISISFFFYQTIKNRQHSLLFLAYIKTLSFLPPPQFRVQPHRRWFWLFFAPWRCFFEVNFSKRYGLPCVFHVWYIVVKVVAVVVAHLDMGQIWFLSHEMHPLFYGYLFFTTYFIF